MVGKLQGELKQTKPFASLEVEAFLNLVRTVDLLERQLTSQLKTHDLSMTQYNVLRILRGAGPAGLPCGEIGTRLVTWDPDITRLIDRLERRGLVARRREEDDRRVVQARLTSAGAAYLKRDGLDHQLLKTHHESLGHLTAAELTSLITVLENIRARIGPKV